MDLEMPSSECPTVELVEHEERGPWGVEIGAPTRSRVVSLDAGASVVIGSGRLADARIDDRTVSARHVRLSATSRGVHVEDLGSKNGVYVGAARVRSAWLAGAASSFVMGRTTVTVRGLTEFEGISTSDGAPIAGLVGSSLPMQRLNAQIRRCAPLRAPVLLLGESGSGKDVVARAIHELSRRTGAYVPLNVGAIPESLADAELFGHRRGAFTGAVAARPGAFEEAHRGTLFLDEIAELSPSIQVKLLRVVEDQKIRPIGGAGVVDVEVRTISATWAPLEERVAAGQFREDLYHRITTFVLRLPPLRSRKADIPALARAVFGRLVDEVGEKELTSAAIARLVAHPWPGNVRELGSVLYRAAAACSARELDARHIEEALVAPHKAKTRALSSTEARSLLDDQSGNVSAASRAAGVPRSTFRSWLAKA